MKRRPSPTQLFDPNSSEPELQFLPTTFGLPRFAGSILSPFSAETAISILFAESSGSIGIIETLATSGLARGAETDPAIRVLSTVSLTVSLIDDPVRPGV